jgi:Holliday junction resolvase-like predicted endonuclease
MVRTAGEYMESIGYEWEVRFDIIAVILQNGRLLTVRHIEDAFFPR